MEKNQERHPEVERREKEVMLIARNLTPEEIQRAIYDYSSTKWHRLNNPNPSMKAGNEGLKIIEK